MRAAGRKGRVRGDDVVCLPAAPPSSEQLVLRVASTGGLMGNGWWQLELPEVSVYADGTAIGVGPVAAVYPGRALPNLLVRHLDPAAVRDLVAASLAAGVTKATDLGRPPIADALTTRFTVVTGGHTYVRDVYALEPGPSGAGLTGAEQSARAALKNLLSRLEDAVPGTSKEQYRPAAVAVLARPWADAPVVPTGSASWPGPTLPGAPLRGRPDTGCLTITGNQATAVLAAAGNATDATRWETPDGGRWALGFRPLLPDETGCADLED